MSSDINDQIDIEDIKGRIDIDFETYSDIDLKKVGAHRYALDPSTDMLCMAYSIDDEEPKLWTPYDSPPEEVFDLVNDGYLLYAWNAAFEICIWEYVTGWPEVHLSTWRDTQAIALNFALPPDLKNCGDVLDIPVKKSAAGTRLINKLSKPQKPTRNQPLTRLTPASHPHLFEELYEYCKDDVRAEQGVYNVLPWELTEQELIIWQATFYKNRIGIPIDMALVNAAVEKIDLYLEEANGMLPFITNKAVHTVGQRDKILDWCAIQGYPLYDLRAETVEGALADPAIERFPGVQQLLTIRSLAGKASVKKFKKIQMAAWEGRVRDCLKYHRATTGREGGRLMQPQNLPRAELKYPEAAIASFVNETFEETLGRYENLIDTASALVRPTICAGKGKHLKVADYNAVENRGVCWLADQNDVLDLYRRGMCVYSDMAASIYGTSYEAIIALGKESKERFHGKQTILGCGYGMAWFKFQQTCAGYGFDISEEEAKKTIRIFRKKNAKVVHLWKMLHAAAVKAILNPGTYTSYKKLSFMFLDGYLYMVLPNGKLLAYPKARAIREENDWGKQVWKIYHEGYDSYTNQWTVLELTASRLAENGTQAVCREALMEAQLDLMALGYNVFLTVHDELVSEDDEDFGSLEEMYAVMCDRSSFFEGFPLKAAGFITYRYKK